MENLMGSLTELNNQAVEDRRRAESRNVSSHDPRAKQLIKEEINSPSRLSLHNNSQCIPSSGLSIQGNRNNRTERPKVIYLLHAFLV